MYINAVVIPGFSCRIVIIAREVREKGKKNYDLDLLDACRIVKYSTKIFTKKKKKPCAVKGR